MANIPKTETIEKVASVYEKTGSISETALQSELSRTKVRKILITEGLWSSGRSRQIQELSERGKTSSEIAQILDISVTMVQNYRPYEKGLYYESSKSGTAVRSEKYRERNRSYAKKKSSISTQQIRIANGEQKDSSPDEKNAQFAMHLHLQLRQSQLDSLSPHQAKILSKYGGVSKSISRDIIVPSSLALHQLHFLINVAFGWTNSHLHSFQLPDLLFQKLTDGKLVQIAPVFGYYLKFPSSIFNDSFWDDDYDESKSPRTWMRSKYLKRYKYKGFSDYWIENQVQIHDLGIHFPILNVYPLRWNEKRKVRKVKFEEATLQDVLGAISFPEGMPDILKESLRLHEILSLTPEDIESAKAAALATDKSEIQLYKKYRDLSIENSKRPEGYLDMSAFTRMERIRKKAEPKNIKPVTSELLYSYDFGDGWEIDISLVEEFGKGNRKINNEIAEKVIADRKPVCIAKDGLNVLDDCGNIYGYIDMLRTIHEDNPYEALEMREWARGQGWTGRDVKPKNLI